MVDISFLLPSNREFSDFGKRVIDNINSLSFNNLSYEIIFVSPFNVSGHNVINVSDNNIGCVDAYNKGYKASSGRYVFLCSDDHFFNYNAPNIINIIESNLYKERKYKIICLPTNRHGACKLPEYTNCDSIIARYPVFRRDTIEQYLQGYIYHPSFNHHYPDNWLGYWLAKQGEPAIEYDKYDMLTFYNTCYAHYDTTDELTFKQLIEAYKNGKTSYV